MAHAQTHKPPVVTGALGRCPRCGNGRLFSGYLTIAPRCEVCGLDYGFADSGDGPAVLVMFPVGTLVVLLWLATDALFHPPVLVHLALWLPATVLLSLAFLRPFKGILINLQYKADARQSHNADLKGPDE